MDGLFGTRKRTDPDHDADLEPVYFKERHQGTSLCPPDTLKLLRECQEALMDRPPRFQRTFVRCGGDRDGGDGPGSSIRVMQWNILAQALGEGLDIFVGCPLDALRWSQRKYLILEEILTYRPHIVCLQEVDHFYDTFQPILASLGYGGRFCPKPFSLCLAVDGNNGPDGCALFYDQSRFELLGGVNMHLSAPNISLIPTNQVAVVTMLRCRLSGRSVCVAVTHLKARAGWEHVRSAQGSYLLQQLQNLIWDKCGVGGSTAGGPADTPLLICGDLNAVPTEEVHRKFATFGLDSAYKKLSPDGTTEPEYTTWKIRPTGECCSTLDYIWYTPQKLSVEAVLDMPSEEQIGPNRLPSYSYPSDHLSLVCDFRFKEKE